MNAHPARSRFAAALFVAVWLVGCDELSSVEDAKKAVTGRVEQAAQVVESSAQAVKQVTLGAGSIELQLDSPVKSASCYAAMHVFSDGRPSVLQITSYQDPSGESFPSVFFRAETKAKAPAELNGQKLAAQAFVQTSSTSAVWQAVDKPLDMTVSVADDATISASIAGALVNVETGGTLETTGTLTGSFPPK